MALYYKWDVKNGFAFVLKFLSLVSDDLGGVYKVKSGGTLIWFCFFENGMKLKIPSDIIPHLCLFKGCQSMVYTNYRT